MTPEQLIERRRATWQALETLLTRAARSLRGLQPSEVDDLGRLYRAVTADLALAQRDFPAHPVAGYLNQLVGQAHSLVYGEKPLQREALARFYRQGFPQLYRKLLPYTLAAFLLFALPALVAFALVWQQPQRLTLMAGEWIAPLMEQVEQGEMWTEVAPAVRSAAATGILTNNIQVMFLTFAGGLTAGLLTLWVLVSNGMDIGGVFGLLQAHGMALRLVDFVVAHGFIELSVIFLAGGCGLYVGDGLIRPGLQGRRARLVERARTGVLVILACAPLLVVAGLIEGFISPSGLPTAVKAAIGLLTGGLLYAYWLRAGRDRARAP